MAHFWAASVHGEQKRIHEFDGPHDDQAPPIGPASIALIPRFIAYAEEFSRLYSSLPQLERGDAPSDRPHVPRSHLTVAIRCERRIVGNRACDIGCSVDMTTTTNIRIVRGSICLSLWLLAWNLCLQ